MFTADMRERDQDKIHMKGLTAAGFGHILRFMYYGSLELSMPTVQEILQVAFENDGSLFSGLCWKFVFLL